MSKCALIKNMYHYIDEKYTHIYNNKLKQKYQARKDQDQDTYKNCIFSAAWGEVWICFKEALQKQYFFIYHHLQIHPTKIEVKEKTAEIEGKEKTAEIKGKEK